MQLVPYARVPVNGKLPIGPMPISPEMLSPATLPVKASVSGIGLVMETFQATSSPEVVPSKISVELPSAPSVPVSVPPALLSDSVAWRSPIGVVITRFQFPSTAISFSPRVTWMKSGRYNLSRRSSPIVLFWLLILVAGVQSRPHENDGGEKVGSEAGEAILHRRVPCFFSERFRAKWATVCANKPHRTNVF